MLMYNDELDLWLAEARQEEAKAQARLAALGLSGEPSIVSDLGPESETNNSTIEISLGPEETVCAEEEDIIVRDGGEVTTIHRPVLPDITST